MFEITPPMRRAKQETIDATIDKTVHALEDLKSVNYVDIPEIIEENYVGAPFYKNMDGLEFGSLLGKKTSAKMVINKVTPHFASEKEFESWLNESVASYGFKHFVFVGGTYATVNYPGPTVIRADEIASGLNHLSVGNICIPTRPQEAARLLAKTDVGASFFTTQLIFEAETTKKMLEEYAAKCKERKINPATFFLSFAPVGRPHDIDFFKWLGAEVPVTVENTLRNSTDITNDSIKLATDVFSDIFDFTKDKKLGVELAPNVEAIFGTNLEHACKLAVQIRETVV